MDASSLKDDDVIYYLATSLDGYIADPNGDISWLNDYFIPELGFHDFISRVDSIIMGRHTWDKIQSFGDWPYGKIPGTIATNSPLEETEAPVTVAAGAPDEILAVAKAKKPGPCWITGGANLASQFLESGTLTRIDLFTIPIVLGEGTSAFCNKQHVSLDLIDSQTYPKGIVRTSWRPQAE